MRIFLLTIAFLAAAACSAGSLLLTDPAPVFEKPDRYAKVLRMQQPGPVETQGEPFTGFSARHPLATCNTFYALPGGGYLSPELVCETAPGGERAVIQLLPRPTLRILAALGCGVALGFLLLRRLRRRNPREGEPPPAARQEALFYLALIVLVRMLLLLNTLLEWPNTIAAAADENGYFETAAGMLAGNFTGPWSFTAGTGLLYLPFILATGAESYYGIAVPFSYFSGFVLAPGALVLGFLILRRLGLSNLRAALPMLAWAAWPFFHFHVELWNRNIFQSVFLMPGGSPWNFYGTLINAGFNAMSDTPSLCAVLGSIALALYMPPKRRFVLLLGLLFGFACLLRINNIFFAPLLAWIAAGKFPEALRSPKQLCGLLPPAAAGFLAVFGFQLWINFHQFGNPLTFGYVLHYPELAEGLRPANGFTLRTFLEGRNIRFLAGANHAAWTLGITGLLLLRDPKLRTAFTLWAVPVIWFFFGYSHTFCDARRFVAGAFPAMLAAFAALECWGAMSRRELAVTLGLACGATLFTLPAGSGVAFLPFLLPAAFGPWLRLIPAALFACGVRFLFQRRLQSAFLCMLLPLLLLFGHPYLYAALLALILLRALFSLRCDATQRQ
ncbi:MAG: hypothetical protein HPZ91_17345 [Lentisphaeria bacterium]|nr:hypothetical protein [Lentisphaeria bacterium]